jgi:DNA polymerase-3 subunit delta'
MEFFKDYPIHSKAKERITNSILNKKLAHAYLFYGPAGCGKEAFALELAKAVNCQDETYKPCNNCPPCQKITQLIHPDIKFIFPTASTWKAEDLKLRLKIKAENPYRHLDLKGHTTIQINRIRELKNEAKYSPYEAQKKVYIITDADKLTREGANSFLKMLEEPPDTLLIILITSAMSTLLDTIRSRCHHQYFPVLTPEESLKIIEKYIQPDERIKRLNQIAQGNLKSLFEMIDHEDQESRQHMLSYLRAVASGDSMKISNIIDTISAKRDKNYLKDLLNLLILWFKDALHLSILGNKTQLINIDFAQELIKFTDHYQASNFEEIVSEIEKAVENVDRNIYNPLILTLLSIRIKRKLVRKV